MFPTKESHPYLFSESNLLQISDWVSWLKEAEFHNFEGAPEDLLRNLRLACIEYVRDYVKNPKSLVKRQMPMAFAFLNLSEENQHLVLQAGTKLE